MKIIIVDCIHDDILMSHIVINLKILQIEDEM